MELRGDRIVLRPWREDDAESVYVACQDPEILHWIPIPRPYTPDHALAFVTGSLDLGPYQFAITEDDQPVGSIGIRVNEQNKIGNIGYWCARLVDVG